MFPCEKVQFFPLAGGTEEIPKIHCLGKPGNQSRLGFLLWKQQPLALPRKGKKDVLHI